MSVGTGVGGSDVIQGRIPLAQLGNPSQVQIIATSSVGGTVSIAGNTWAGVNISTPIPPNVPGASPQPIPATGTLTLGLLLLAVFALSFVAYRRRYGRYHWLLIVLCLPVVFTVAWALTWTTVTSTKSGNIHQLNVAADNNNLHIQLHVDIGKTTSGNQAPTDITLSNASVAENAVAAVIGNLTTTDPDSGDSHTYSVSDSRFEVVGNQLKLKAGQALDYETETSVTLTVTSTDNGSLTFSKDFTLTVTNVNEAPTDITLSNASVAENAVAAVIGNLTTTDPDSGDSHTYSVSDSRFEVVGNQLKLKAGQALDYETETSVTLTVTSTDNGSLTFSKDFTLTVTNVNEAPTDITLSNASVAENAVAAVIGNLTTTDPDSGDSHTYGVSDSRFEVVGNQLKLKAGQALDYETETSVTLTVTTTDSGGLTFNEGFTLTVTDVLEPTRILNDTGITWGGNYPSGSNSNCTGAVIAAQDCSHGRDAAALAGTLTKVGGGSAGFDFTKLDSSGNALAATATTWSCVRDNVTGLIWEVKDDNGGLHDKDNTYTWYNSDSSTNGGNAGTQNGGTCSGGGDCDTAGLVTAVNAAGLCGQNDWRVPAREELRSIVDYSRAHPAIDTDYFPNTQHSSSRSSGFYWSSSPSASNNSSAWGVYFYYGVDYYRYMSNSRYVRLVRGGQ